MSVVKLSIKNFLSISDVEIQPGKLNQIYGANNQGKTTVLKALEFAFKGSTDGSMVKHGNEQAEVVVELDDMVIKRRLSAEGEQKVEVSRGGFKADKPQSFLNGLFDGMSFNPLEILDPKMRTQFILKALNLKMTKEEVSEISGVSAEELPPVDFDKENTLTAIDQVHKYFYARRAEANKTTAEKRRRWETYAKDLPPETAAPKTRQEINEKASSLNAILVEREKAMSEIEAQERAQKASRDKAERYAAELVKIQAEIDSLQAEYERRHAVLLERLENGKAAVQEAKKEIREVAGKEKVQQEIANVKKALSDLSLEEKSLELYESQQKQRKAVEEMERDFKKSEEQAKEIDRKVSAFGPELVNKIIERSELPVQGFAYQEGEFRLNGSSLDHLSSSAALKLSLALVKKLAGKTKLICIDGAELLDNEAFKTLQEEIQGDEFTYFFTKVGEPFVGADRNYKAQEGVLEGT